MESVKCSLPCKKPLCIVVLINLKMSVIKTIYVNDYNILTMLYHLGWEPNIRSTLNAILLCRSHLSTATASVNPPIPNIDESCNKTKTHTKWLNVFIPKLCKNIQHFKGKNTKNGYKSWNGNRAYSYNYRVCQVGDFLRVFRFTPPLKLTASWYNWNIVVKVE